MGYQDFMGVGAAAKLLGVSPRAISHRLYEGTIDPARCPLVAGRRVIPTSMLPEIAEILGVKEREECAVA